MSPSRPPSSSTLPAHPIDALKLPALGDPADRTIAAEIKALLDQSKKIAITGHERPDGDCIGSEVAMCLTLEQAGYKAEIINSDPTPQRYQFLDPQGRIKRFSGDKAIDADLVIVLDSTDLNRLSRIKNFLGPAPILNIDHHLNNPRYGKINWVDTSAAATGELIWRLAACLGWTVPALGLEALYTALVTDTGQFAYSNTSARVMRMAAELLEHGVDSEELWRRIYLNKAFNELALESKARASLKCEAGGKICTISLKHQDFVETNTSFEHTEEFASIPRSIAGVQLSLFMYEINGGTGTKVSVRTTRDIDACALAQKFGGGGHKQAAGCTLPYPLEETMRRFLVEAEKVVK